jgi:Ras-related protein Rab-5C
LEKARSWIRELQRQADPSIIIALCGNKTDLAARRQVTQEEAQKYAQEEGLMWCEASAKTGEGVQDIFMTIGLCLDWVMIRVLIYRMRHAEISAKKLPLSAPQSQKGAARAAGNTQGVDLSKQTTPADACNC